MSYAAKKAQLQEVLQSTPNAQLRLQKKTASNLFRYVYQKKNNLKAIAIKNFDEIIGIDKEQGILEVEGLTPYEKIVEYTLQNGFLPTVAPELKHITIGGATVGIGIESTGFKYGFVHDGLLEAEVLLPNGNIVLCTPDNEHADLFHGLPNSYGSLGYILRAKIKLYPAKPFVKVSSIRFSNLKEYIDSMQKAVTNGADFIEGLIFSEQEQYLILGKMVNEANRVENIYQTIFYKLIQNKREFYLSTFDYIFRYDPDWFWNIPETAFYNWFRRIAPRAWRNSGFYKKYMDTKKKFLALFGVHSAIGKKEESLIQDWEVLWEQGYELTQFALSHVSLNGKPWAVVPIKPLNTATLYPLEVNKLYFNLGCYCSSQRSQQSEDVFFNTKIMDEKCFALGGLKMLYSSTFLQREQFDRIYNGKGYQQLKQKYDPQKLIRSLFEKVSL